MSNINSFTKLPDVYHIGVLYRKGFSVPLLWCAAHDEAKQVLTEVHEGACGDHTRGQIPAKKILRYGYFWSTFNRDAADYTRKCDKCERFAKILRAPLTEITQMIGPWSFVVWGINITGVLPISISKGGAKMPWSRLITLSNGPRPIH